MNTVTHQLEPEKVTHSDDIAVFEMTGIYPIRDEDVTTAMTHNANAVVGAAMDKMMERAK